jgi:hypothetical protein
MFGDVTSDKTMIENVDDLMYKYAMSSELQIRTNPKTRVIGNIFNYMKFKYFKFIFKQ